MDVENPDESQFPLFLAADYKEGILQPGDMLYIPIKHWHYVRSLSNSFSVSFWWKWSYSRLIQDLNLLQFIVFLGPAGRPLWKAMSVTWGGRIRVEKIHIWLVVRMLHIRFRQKLEQWSNLNLLKAAASNKIPPSTPWGPPLGQMF